MHPAFKFFTTPAAMVVVGVLLVLVWVFANFRRRGGAAEGFEDNGLNASYITAAPYKFHMYYVDWCPHCHSAKPEFDKLGSKMTIGGNPIVCEAIEAEKNPEKVLGKPEGFPTIQLYNAEGKMVKEYSGERTESGFRSFLEDILNRPRA